MEKFIFAILACFSSLTATAQTNQENNVLTKYETSQTGIVSKAYPLAIAYTPSGNNVPPGGVSAKAFDSTKPLYFQFYSITNRPRPLVFFYLKPAYAFKISASSENGEVVKPTRKGAKYGVDFDNLKTFDRDYIDKTGRRNPYWNTTALVNRPGGIGDPISSPDELFNFPKPGKYTMTIEAACFVTYEFLPRYNSTNYFLVKFPPVKLTVIKKGN